MTIRTDTSISPVIRVSAIVSAYNSELYMYGCLVDLTQQTLFTKGELEIVIIDSGSEHNEADVVKEFQRNHPDRIIYKRTNRETLYAAWNRGIELSRGEYLTNANTDDRHRIDGLEIMANTLDQQPEFDLVYGDCHVSAVPNETFENNAKTKVLKYPDFFAPSALLHYQFGPQPMWRKSTHKKIGYFDPTYGAAGDYDFNIRFALKCKALHIPEVLGLYLAVPTAISFRDNKMDKENSRISISYHTLDTVEQLYKAAGFPWESSAEKARLYLDMGNRASEFYTPWGKGKAEQNTALARTCFQRATELAPDWPPAGNNLAVSLFQAGKKDQAIKLLELISRVRSNPVVTVNLDKMKNPAQQIPDLTLLDSDLAAPCQKQLAAGTPVTPGSMESTSESRSGAQCEAKIQRETIGSILLVSHGFPPAQIGGTQLYVQALARQLHQSGYLVRVLFPKHDTINPTGHITEYVDQGILIAELSVQPEKHPLDLGQREQRFCNRETASAFKNFLARSKPDLIHFHHVIGLSGTALESAHDLDIPTVLTLHDGWFFCDQYHFILPDGSFCENGSQSAERCATCHAERNGCSTDGNSLVSLMETRKKYLSSVLRFADTIIVPSNYLFKKLSKHGLSHPHILINPLGLRPTLPVTRKHAPDKVRFAYLGHIMPVKGLDILLRAVNLLSSNHAQLDIYGHTLDTNYFATSINALDPGIPVQYHGTYAPDDLPAILAQIDVAVIPSRTESFCFTLRECLQAGIPVLASDSGALPEIVIDGENGLLFEAGNHFDLAKKMNSVLDTPGKREALSAAIKPVKLIEQECREIAEIYTKAIARKADNTASSAAPCAPSTDKAATRLIAFHLPQFHSIPENDEWWGKGFTEWTNVAKARSLFEGHYQPHVPADLGYYDLSSPSAMSAQADLAQEYGIHGFCFYHYWFNGKLLLETPLHQMLQSGQPDFPFCLCWANEDWTRVWDGKSGETLIKQTYTDEDDLAHIQYLFQFFTDRRYIKINGKPLFLVYRASRMPNPKRTTALWRELAKKNGIGDLYLCRVESSSEERIDPSLFGFDAAVEFQPDWNCLPQKRNALWHGIQHVYDYEEFSKNSMNKPEPPYPRYPCVLVSWDNSPRRENGIAQIFTESSPQTYERWLRDKIIAVNKSELDEKIVFINAWNEWGEGNHLEPDQKWGRSYLQATKNALSTKTGVKSNIAIKICTPSRDAVGWGDTHFADALAKALESAGHFVRIDFLNEWGRDDLDIDVVIHIKGLSEYKPKPYNVNIMWMLNHPTLHTRDELERYDAVLVASLPHAHRLKNELQVPVFPFLQATDPVHFHPHAEILKQFDLVFVGNNIGVDRLEMRQIIADLLPTQHRLAVWGKGWEGVLPPGVLQDEFIIWQDLPLAYASAHIVLNDHQPEMKEYGFVNNRMFDALACGATVISDDVSSIEQVVPVHTYTNPNDLKSLVDKLLSDEREFADLSKNLRLKVLKEFTFDQRVKELEAILETLTAAKERAKDATSRARSVLSEKRPLVSVLMSTYNRRRFLQTAIDSIREQDYGNWELIIVNDGGESVSDIVARFADNRIHLINLENNRGKGHAINRAFRESRGGFIAYLDDDDIWYPDHLERLLLPLLTIPGIEMSYSNAYDVWLSESSDKRFHEVRRELRYNHQVIFQELLSQNYIQGLSVVHRRNLYERTGGMDERLEVLIDWDLWRRLAALTYAYHVSSVTAEHFFRKFTEGSHKGQITDMARSDLIRYEKNKLRIAKKRFSQPIEERYENTLSKLRRCAKLDFISARISDAEMMGDIRRVRRSYKHAIRLSNEERVEWLRRYAEFELVSGDLGKTLKSYEEIVRLNLAQGNVNSPDILTCALIKARTGSPVGALETLSYLDRADYPYDFRIFTNNLRENIAAFSEPAWSGSRETNQRQDVEAIKTTFSLPNDRIKSHVSESRTEEAIRVLEQHVKQSAIYCNDLGVLYHQHGNTEQTLRHYKNAVALDPDNTLFKKNLADFMCVEKEDYQTGLNIYLEVFQQEPDNEVRAAICIICEKLGISPEELLKSESVPQDRKKVPGNNLIKDEYVSPEAGQKNIISQLRSLEESLRANPRNAFVYNDLGILHGKLGNSEKAGICFEKAVELSPRNPTLQKNLADFYVTIPGRLEEAMRIYFQLLSEKPTDIDTLLSIGTVCKMLGNMKDGFFFNKKILELDPWNTAAWKYVQEFINQRVAETIQTS